MRDRGAALLQQATIDQPPLHHATAHENSGRRALGAALIAALTVLAACSDGGNSRSAPAFALAGDSPTSSAEDGASAGSSGSPSIESNALTPAGSNPASTEGNPSPSGIANPAPNSGMPAAPQAPGLKFVGRVDVAGADDASFAWSGSGVIANFSGSSLAVRLAGGQQYTVLIDGMLQPKLSPTGGLDVLASGLAEGPHSVELYRRTEANQGESRFLGFDFGGGQLLAPPAPAERRIEIVGDSITAGYGNEGADMNCTFSPDTENHYLTYGALSARALGAELSTVAWSGKGVVCNYGDDAASCSDPLPPYYDRTLPARADSRWDFSRWQPQAVVINLGTNDFSTAMDPTQEQFEQALGALIEHMRAGYPGALILATVGPLLTGADLATARTYIANVVKQRNDAGDAKVQAFELAPTNAADGYGCDWHPSLKTHQVMAEALTAKLRAELGW
jgi:lysophospholipase L1-like esterase